MGDEVNTEVEEEAKPDKVFTQEEVNALTTRSKEKGQKEAVNEALKALGFDSLEAAQKTVKTWKEKETAEMTETERIKSEKAELEKNYQKKEEEYTTLQTEVALLKAGVSPDKVSKAAKLIGDYEGETIDSKAKALLEDLPIFGGKQGVQDFGKKDDPKTDAGDLEKKMQKALRGY